MKLLHGVKEAAPAKSGTMRAKGGSAGVPDNSGRFGDVLAGVAGKREHPKAAALPSKAAAPKPPRPAGANVRDPLAQDAKGGGENAPIQLLDLIGDRTDAAGAPAAAPDESAPASTPGLGGADVGSLLKRLKSKHAGEDAQAAPDESAAPDPLPSFAVAVTAIQHVVTPVDGKSGDSQPAVEAKPAGALSPGLDAVQDRGPQAEVGTPALPAAEPSGQAAATPLPPSPVVQEVSVATHVAPARSTLAPTKPEAKQVKAAAPDLASAPETGSAQPESAATFEAGSSSAQKVGLGDPRGNADNPALDQGDRLKEPARAVVGRGDVDGPHPEEAPRDLDPGAGLPKSVDATLTVSPPAAAPHAAIRSVASAIVELAARAPADAQQSADQGTSLVAPARTVILQMSPADLGTVEIRLHLTGHALDIQLKVSERDTLGLVTRERDTLATALRNQSYELQSLVIQDGSAAAPPGGNHVGTHVASREHAGAHRPEHQSGGNSPGARSGDRGSGQEPGRQGRNELRHGGQEALRGRVADRGSLFV